MSTQEIGDQPGTVPGRGQSTWKSIGSVMGSAFERGDVRRVFGEPIVRNGTTIVPIADVGSAFGFGSGSGSESGKEGEGGGGGGRVTGKPVGYLEISEAGTAFRPVYDFTRLGSLAILAATFLLWMLIRKR
jgi:uncharacterized spore protein YtfJ